MDNGLEVLGGSKEMKIDSVNLEYFMFINRMKIFHVIILL